jgi:hypothetical protein
MRPSALTGRLGDGGTDALCELALFLAWTVRRLMPQRLRVLLPLCLPSASLSLPALLAGGIKWLRLVGRF